MPTRLKKNNAKLFIWNFPPGTLNSFVEIECSFHLTHCRRLVNVSIFSWALTFASKLPSCIAGPIAPLPASMYRTLNASFNSASPFLTWHTPRLCRTNCGGAEICCIYSTLIAAGDKWYIYFTIKEFRFGKTIRNGIFSS